jgi:putative copper export protein
LNSLLLNPWFHHFVLLLHISAGLFWMGWIVFIFFLMVPVLRDRVPERVQSILPALKSRIRRVVFWLIMLIVITGVHNVYYHGLYRSDVLLETAYGQRFLVKIGAALVLFGVYFSAPHLTNHTSGEDEKSGSNRIVLVLHVIAFSAGMLAAFLGLSLRP